MYGERGLNKEEKQAGAELGQGQVKNLVTSMSTSWYTCLLACLLTILLSYTPAYIIPASRVIYFCVGGIKYITPKYFSSPQGYSLNEGYSVMRAIRQ